MSESALYNLSGRAIPERIRIAIIGEPKAGEVLVIESFDGVTGAAYWRTEAELKSRGDKVASKPADPAIWRPQPKPRAPYS